MSDIWEFFSDSANAGSIGCVFFFSLFVYIFIKAYSPSKKQEMKKHGNIPLMED